VNRHTHAGKTLSPSARPIRSLPLIEGIKRIGFEEERRGRMKDIQHPRTEDRAVPPRKGYGSLANFPRGSVRNAPAA